MKLQMWYRILNENLPLADVIGDIENHLADTYLTGNVKLLYATVQEECEDFRDNIFLKNLEILEENIVYDI